MKRIVSAVWLLSAAIAFPAEPKWVHVSSANFDILSSAGEGDTRRVLEHFERVRSFFEQAPGSAREQPSEPARIVIFGSKKEFDPYRPNEFAAAYYTQISGRDYLVFGGIGDNIFPNAVHEYVHLIGRRERMNLPLWLSEGMAELYSTLKPLGDEVLIGKVIPARMQQLSHQNWVPLTTILEATPDSAFYNEKDRAGALYNEGWALTHMLKLSPEYGPKFSAVLQQIANGVPSQAAIESACGKPLSAVEMDLRLYLQKGTLTGRLFAAKLQTGPGGKVEPAQPFDVKLTLLDLGDRPGKEADTLQKFSALAAEYPARPEPQSALAYLDWRAGHPEDATHAFTKAFDNGGRSPQMLWDYGRLAANTGDAANAIRALNALLELQPDRLDARLVLAGIDLNFHRTKEALETLASVKSVPPADAPRLFEILAYAKLLNGDKAAARTNGLLWVENAREGAERERAANFLLGLDRAIVFDPN